MCYHHVIIWHRCSVSAQSCFCGRTLRLPRHDKEDGRADGESREFVALLRLNHVRCYCHVIICHECSVSAQSYFRIRTLRLQRHDKKGGRADGESREFVALLRLNHVQRYRHVIIRILSFCSSVFPKETVQLICETCVVRCPLRVRCGRTNQQSSARKSCIRRVMR